MTHPTDHTPTYARVYAVAREIPAGRVATYGQLAAMVGHCTARMVGYAMASLPDESDVPWHRVINAQGKISPRGNDLSTLVQRKLLEDEGLVFGADGRVALQTVRWRGPDFGWLLDHGFDPEPHWTDDVTFEEEP